MERLRNLHASPMQFPTAWVALRFCVMFVGILWMELLLLFLGVACLLTALEPATSSGKAEVQTWLLMACALLIMVCLGVAVFCGAAVASNHAPSRVTGWRWKVMDWASVGVAGLVAFMLGSAASLGSVFRTEMVQQLNALFSCGKDAAALLVAWHGQSVFLGEGQPGAVVAAP
jgi:hypothetical protein